MALKDLFGKGDEDSEQEAQLKKEIKEAIASITHDEQEEKDIEEMRRSLKASAHTIDPPAPPVQEKDQAPSPGPPMPERVPSPPQLVPEQRPPTPPPAPYSVSPPGSQPKYAPPPSPDMYWNEWVGCSRCGRVAGENDRICTACGAPLFKSCPQCGKVVRAKMRFCIQCGRQF